MVNLAVNRFSGVLSWLGCLWMHLLQVFFEAVGTHLNITYRTGVQVVSIFFVRMLFFNVLIQPALRN